MDGIVVGQRPEEDTLGDGEHGRICADTERESDDGNECHLWSVTQLANGVMDVAEDVWHRDSSFCLANAGNLAAAHFIDDVGDGEEMGTMGYHDAREGEGGEHFGDFLFGDGVEVGGALVE